MPPKKQRNLRKSRALREQEGLSDDEEEGGTLDELRTLQQMRKRKAGVASDALIAGDGRDVAWADAASEEDADSEGEGAAPLGDGFQKAAGMGADEEEDDPHMKKYVEEQLAKRLGKKSGMTDAEALAASRAPPAESELMVPENLAGAPRGGEQEIAGIGPSTGITEVALPVEYKMRNIEATEDAKKALLDRRGKGQHGGEAGASSKMHRTMLPMQFGRHQLIITDKDDSFVGQQMRQGWKDKAKRKR